MQPWHDFAGFLRGISGAIFGYILPVCIDDTVDLWHKYLADSTLAGSMLVSISIIAFLLSFFFFCFFASAISLNQPSFLRVYLVGTSRP